MRILCLMSQDSFRLTLGWALESIGHKVIYLEEVSGELLEQTMGIFRPHVVFDAGWDKWHCNRENLETVALFLKKNRLFHVYYAEEDSLHFQRWSKPYVQTVAPDFVLTRSRTCVQKYCELGFPSKYLNVGCNPEFHRPLAATPKYSCDIALVANAQLAWDIFRRTSISNLVLPLLDQPYVFKIWGKGWDDLHKFFKETLPIHSIQGYLPFHHTPNVYNSSKINISLQSVYDQISSRSFDILASRGFLLTSDTPAVREVLTPGVNCEVSASPEETVEKVAFYLSHDSLREKIADAGRNLAVQKLSYQKTIPDVWPAIEAELSFFRRKEKP